MSVEGRQRVPVESGEIGELPETFRLHATMVTTGSACVQAPPTLNIVRIRRGRGCRAPGEGGSGVARNGAITDVLAPMGVVETDGSNPGICIALCHGDTLTQPDHTKYAPTRRHDLGATQ